MLKRLLRQGGVKGYSMLVCCQGSFKAPLRGPFGGTDAPGSTPNSPDSLARLFFLTQDKLYLGGGHHQVS